jgi:prophage maintenance system killer protein
VHAPNEEKSEDTKDSFHKELEHVFEQSSEYQMQIIEDHLYGF